MVQEDVYLIVGGSALRGFQEVNVTWSQNDAALSFALEATNPAWSADAWALRQGAEVQIFAGGTMLLKGEIDSYESEAEPGKRKVTVSGRSKSAKAIDCPPIKHKTGRIENKDLLAAAKEFDEFGVGFTADVPLNAIPKIQREPRESLWQTLERHARAEGLLLSGQPDGSIKITRGGEKRHAGALINERAPVQSIKVKFDQKGKKSPIVNRSQRALGVDSKSLRQEIKIYDETVGTYRPAVLFNEPDVAEKELKNRADWQRLRQNAAGTNATFTVAGWRDAAGELWTPGKLVFCQYPEERLDQDMMLQSVTFTQNIKDGTTAKLTMVDPATSGAKRGKSSSDKAWNPSPAGFASPQQRE